MTPDDLDAKPRKKTKRRAYDLYETPEWAVESFLNLVPVNPKWKYLEPCRASGRIYNHLPLGSAWGEIREGINYLNTSYPHVDVIITNPPYSLAQEFIEKGLREADVVIMLLRLGFLESMKRFEFWKKYPIQHLVTLSKRPSFTDDGNTDGSGYAVFIWDKNGKLGLSEPFYWITEQEEV